jgi:hypothetical protein
MLKELANFGAVAMSPSMLGVPTPTCVTTTAAKEPAPIDSSKFSDGCQSGMVVWRFVLTGKETTYQITELRLDEKWSPKGTNAIPISS